MRERLKQSGRRRSPARARRWLLAAACAALGWSLRASAQDDAEAAETAAARALALEGIKLADAGRCEDAIDKLARAERLHHAPVVLGRLGECQVQQGKLVEGTENLRKVLREALPPEAPQVISRARERAATVLERAKIRIAALHIVVRGPADQESVLVAVDGQPMNVALLGADRPTDPGEHLVEASAPGYFVRSARVSVGAGDKQTVVLELEPGPNADRAAASAAAAGGVATATDDGNVLTRVAPFSDPTAPRAHAPARSAVADRPDDTAAYIAWAAGGGAIAVGSIFGLLAISGKNDLDERCTGNSCPESAQGRLDSARSASTAATVLMALGGSGLALGTVLYFTAGDGEKTTEQARNSRTRKLAQNRHTAHARPWIGLGQIGLSGEF